MARDGVAVSPEVAALVARFVDGERFNVRAEAAGVGISRSTFYKYVTRFRAAGVEGLFPISRRPRTSPTAVSADLEDAVVRARKCLDDEGWDAGAEQILFWLEDYPAKWLAEPGGPLPVLPSRASVNRILTRRGLVTPMPQRAPKKTRRFEHAHPNTLWQMDGFEWQLVHGPKVCVLEIVDDHSRVDIVLRAIRSENGIDVWNAFTAAAAEFGLPRMVLTDNGSGFSGKRRGWTSILEENLAELGVRHIASSVSHPQTCGKVERAHSPVEKWLRKRRTPPETLAELETLLEVYRDHNNNRRRRTHLGKIAPMTRYRLGQPDGPGQGPVPHPLAILERSVSPSGTIRVDSKELGIGRAYKGQTVHVFKQGKQLTIIAGHKHLATFTLTGRTRYQAATKSGTLSADA